MLRAQPASMRNFNDGQDGRAITRVKTRAPPTVIGRL